METILPILERLIVADNGIRSAAEAQYKHWQSIGSEDLCVALLQVIGEVNINMPLRILAAVLLRRLLIEDNNGQTLQEMTETRQAEFCQLLLVTLDQEVTMSLKLKICDIVGELGGYIIEEGEWPDVLPFTYRLLTVSFYLCIHVYIYIFLDF